jgi:hypothetical protein
VYPNACCRSGGVFCANRNQPLSSGTSAEAASRCGTGRFATIEAIACASIADALELDPNLFDPLADKVYWPRS